MTEIRVKHSRTTLDPVAYDKLHWQVLERDGWSCQVCGSYKNLEVHHKEFRSHQGSDTEENLITLCNSCHRATHGQ